MRRTQTVHQVLDSGSCCLVRCEVTSTIAKCRQWQWSAVTLSFHDALPTTCMRVFATRKDCVLKPLTERRLGCADHCSRYIQGGRLQHRALYASIALYQLTSRRKLICGMHDFVL